MKPSEKSPVSDVSDEEIIKEASEVFDREDSGDGQSCWHGFVRGAVWLRSRAFTRPKREVSDEELRSMAFKYAAEREETIPEFVCKKSTRRHLIEAGFKAGYRLAMGGKT